MSSENDNFGVPASPDDFENPNIVRGDGFAAAGYAIPPLSEAQKRRAELKAKYSADGNVLRLGKRKQ